jgi:predicted RNA-binding Zn-ribbon protein involved in translation (DUF1610 family)
MKVNFKCEKCGHNIIEEVLEGVRKYSTIINIEMMDNGYAAVEYGNSNDEYGNLDRYQCAACGSVIEGCYTENSLFDYLKENNMLKE